MTTAYTNLLGLALPVVGELDGTWGAIVNNAITQLVEDAVANTATASVTSGDWTLTTTGSGASNEARMAVLIPTGSPGVSRNIIAPAHSKTYVVINQSNASVVLKGTATTGVTIGTGLTALVVWNGSDFVEVKGQSVANLSGGIASQIPYQSGAGATTFLANGTSGQILRSNGTSAPSWTTTVPSATTATTATTATNIAGGIASQIPYQSGAGATTFLVNGTSGQVLTSNGTSAPSWTTPSPTSVNTGTNSNISGLLKGSGATLSAATVRIDYGESTTALATGILKNTTSTGTHTIAVAETDYVTPTGTGTLSGKTVTGLKLTKTAPTISAGVLPIDCSSGSAFAVSLNANITSFTMTNVPASGTYYEFLLEFTADGTARTITWSFSGTTVKWASGVAPIMSSTNNKKDILVFYTYDGGTNWLGFIAGQNL